MLDVFMDFFDFDYQMSQTSDENISAIGLNKDSLDTNAIAVETFNWMFHTRDQNSPQSDSKLFDLQSV